jgi:class 3 adenylate cyclase
MPACDKCGEENPSEARLCWSCGAPVERRVAGREERRLVTVLFVDLVGFSGLAERLDPEDLEDVTTPYFERVRGELERFGGRV